ncbi:MAG: alpha/beta hydrolase, partial [Pseudomonadales bacterium]
MPYANSHGLNIYYEVHEPADNDTAATLILAHGMGGNAAIWFNQLAHFCDRYRIVTFDHRYFARSTCDADAFDPALFTHDIIAVMDAAAVEHGIFICQSMGGWTGSQMAIRHA